MKMTLPTKEVFREYHTIYFKGEGAELIRRLRYHARIVMWVGAIALAIIWCLVRIPEEILTDIPEETLTLYASNATVALFVITMAVFGICFFNLFAIFLRFILGCWGALVHDPLNGVPACSYKITQIVEPYDDDIPNCKRCSRHDTATLIAMIFFLVAFILIDKYAGGNFGICCIAAIIIGFTALVFENRKTFAKDLSALISYLRSKPSETTT